MATKSKRIDIRVSEKELSQIDRLAAKAHMSRSKYLISAALCKQITVIEDGKEIARQLSKIGGNINSLKIRVHQGTVTFFYFDKFAEEMRAVWQLLSSSISETGHTPE